MEQNAPRGRRRARPPWPAAEHCCACAGRAGQARCWASAGGGRRRRAAVAAASARGVQAAIGRSTAVHCVDVLVNLLAPSVQPGTQAWAFLCRHALHPPIITGSGWERHSRCKQPPRLCRRQWSPPTRRRVSGASASPNPAPLHLNPCSDYSAIMGKHSPCPRCSKGGCTCKDACTCGPSAAAAQALLASAAQSARGSSQTRAAREPCVRGTANPAAAARRTAAAER